MYAVIQAGGHQYRVKEGESLTIDRIPGSEGDKVTFDKVMMIGGKEPVIGKPLVEGASVEATIKTQERLPKVIVFKYKRRKNYKRKKGHAQPVTKIEIGKISS